MEFDSALTSPPQETHPEERAKRARRAESPEEADLSPAFSDNISMTGNANAFCLGVTALRDAKDLAERHRDGFVREANARLPEIAARQAEAARVRACYLALREVDAELQQLIAEEIGHDSDYHDGAWAFPQHSSNEDGSRELGKEPVASGNPSERPASSSMSGLLCPRCSGLSLSSGSQSTESQASSSRVRPDTPQRAAESSSTSAAQPPPTGPGEIYWVGLYWRRGMVAFRDLSGEEVRTRFDAWTRRVFEGREYFYWLDTESGRTLWAREMPRRRR